MGQHRFWNWKEDDSTDIFNRHDIGILPEGLYRGYDPVIPGSGLILTLIHSGTGYYETDGNGDAVGPYGLSKSRQGVLVVEDGDLQVTFNVGDGTLPRIDLVVMEHEYVQVLGGQPAAYAIIEGTPDASPTAPALPSPETQVILGRLYVPAGMTNLSGTGVIYTKEPMPLFGNDERLMLKDIVQSVAGKKYFTETAGMVEAITIAGANLVADKARNFYTLANTNANYILIISLTMPQTLIAGSIGYFEIRTLQKLDIVTSGNILLSGSPTPMKIEAGEVIGFWDLSDLMGITKYLCIKGGEASRSAINKFYNKQLFAKGTDISVTGGTNITLLKGNFFKLIAGANAQVTSIANNNQTPGGNANGGGIFAFHCTGKIKFKHNGTAGAGFKSVIISNGLDLNVEAGSTVMLVEDLSEYRVLAVVSPEIGPEDAAITYDANWHTNPTYPFKYYLTSDRYCMFEGMVEKIGGSSLLIATIDAALLSPKQGLQRWKRVSMSGIDVILQLQLISGNYDLTLDTVIPGSDSVDLNGIIFKIQ